MTASNRYEMEHGLLAKALADRGFLMLLHGNPKAALQSFLGHALPANINVRLLIEDDKTLYALLPHASHDFMGNLAMPQLPQNAREQFEANINAKLAADPSLMQSFRADPSALVRTMAPLGAGVTVKLAEETADTVYIIIPYYGKSTYRV